MSQNVWKLRIIAAHYRRVGKPGGGGIVTILHGWFPIVTDYVQLFGLAFPTLTRVKGDIE